MYYTGILTVSIIALAIVAIILITVVDIMVGHYKEYQYLKDTNCTARHIVELRNWMSSEDEKVSWVLLELGNNVSRGCYDGSSFRDKFRKRFAIPDENTNEEEE